MSERFTVINESFVCEHCGAKNPPANKTCRNHCRECLHSKHVDINPGDRACNCHGLLTPVGVTLTGGYWQDIKFKCQKCSFTGVNKVTDDDNREVLLALLSKV